ncbi:hypothetical protein P3T43_004688 [Paraburkholderia sp. GAS41]|jgi:hypothetical protein|uniref:hypothetical protein n=1 Tax=Paraburkholderia sp. GAS41 TaxID=3035134 RepID=UPI003D191686
MNQIQTCTLDQHNRATHLAHENERLREAMHVIAVIAAGAISPQQNKLKASS